MKWKKQCVKTHFEYEGKNRILEHVADSGSESIGERLKSERGSYKRECDDDAPQGQVEYSSDNMTFG